MTLSGEATDWNRPPRPGTVVTSCMSCFMTGVPDKECRTNKPPPTGRVRERSKGDTACPSTSQNPSCQHPSWLSDACATRRDSELEWLAKDHPETNPITIKPDCEPGGRAVLLGSLTLLLSTRVPFPIKSLALSAHMSPWTIHFWVLDKNPVSGPGRGSSSCNNSAAAKLLQSCLTLWNPIDSSPPGSAIPEILQARTLEWVAISFSRNNSSLPNLDCLVLVPKFLWDKKSSTKGWRRKSYIFVKKYFLDTLS